MFSQMAVRKAQPVYATGGSLHVDQEVPFEDELALLVLLRLLIGSVLCTATVVSFA